MRTSPASIAATALAVATSAATTLALATSSVALAAAAAEEDIRDIRGSVSAQSAWWLPALAVVAVLLVLAVMVFLRWRRRRKVVPPLPLHELALRRLDAARAQMAALGAPAFAVAASDIVRQYIEARFGVAVTRRTTEEFLTDILAAPDSALARHRDSLRDFLGHCDYAKFGVAAVELDSVEAIYRGARTFVSETAHRDLDDQISAA